MSSAAPGAVAAAVRPRKRHRTPWLDWLAVPTIAILVLVIGYPIVRAIYLSVFDYSLLTGNATAEFTGLANYRALLSDPVFLASLRHTAVFTFGSVLGAGLVGLLLALATEHLDGPWRWLRGALLTPWAVPIIVVAFLFRFLFLDRGGLVNSILQGLGIVDSSVAWLTSGQWALATVTATNIWQQAPFFLLVFTAALRGVPNEVVESARIDRVRGLSMVAQIKLPFLRGPALVAALIMIIQNFNNFPLIWAMTQGGPAYSTTTLVIYIYRIAFVDYELGYASAMGVLWLAFLMIVAWLFVRRMRGDRV